MRSKADQAEEGMGGEREQCWQKLIPNATETQIPPSPGLRGSKEARGLSPES